MYRVRIFIYTNVPGMYMSPWFMFQDDDYMMQSIVM